MSKETKEQFAEAMSVSLEQVYWCEICEVWSVDDVGGFPLCACA